MNSFGQLFKLTTWGESHGKAIGGVIDGCVPGIELDLAAIAKDMQRRKPGQSAISTPRKEEDSFEILSGLINRKTTGQPISFIIHNTNTQSADYNNLQTTFRPSHADYTYTAKYGLHDHNGGGRSSARETANWVLAGSIAKQILHKKNIHINAFVKSIGPIKLETAVEHIDVSKIDTYITRCPDAETSSNMETYLQQMLQEGNTCGGSIQCIINGLPVGLGEPIFDKINARLAQAMMTINAARAFELGDGMHLSTLTGKEVNDAFIIKDDAIQTQTNHSAGIQGGITNGMPVWFQVYFKPVSSIKTAQKSVDTHNQEVTLEIQGRHDPCVVPRAVPIVEALAYMICLDFILLQNSYRMHD
jgi:chorismate synthase